jgi:hypothetical protein
LAKRVSQTFGAVRKTPISDPNASAMIHADKAVANVQIMPNIIVPR